MNKHEIETLRDLVKKFRRDGAFLFAKTERNSGVEVDSCARQLEHLLDTFPTPDDGLREGFTMLLARADTRVKYLVKEDALEQAVELSYWMEQIKDLLAKTPDHWKPISAAPRDEREIIAWFISGIGEREEFVSWYEKNGRGRWKDRRGNFWGDNCFTHYREKLAPPREGLNGKI